MKIFRIVDYQNDSKNVFIFNERITPKNTDHTISKYMPTSSKWNWHTLLSSSFASSWTMHVVPTRTGTYLPGVMKW